MGFGDLHGRARVSPLAPEAFGVCDECGVWYNRRDLTKNMEFSGRSLIWTGGYVCKTCNDTPNAQLLTPILPPDPRPIREPRPENFINARRQMGFTFLVLTLAPGDAASILTQIGRLVPPMPATGTPAGDAVMVLGPALGLTSILAANAQRTWLAIYNPGQSPVIVSTGNAAFSGDPAAIILGQGQAIYSADYQGAMTATGYFAGLPLFVFEAPIVAGAVPIPVVFP
jgi:hypothetical protein